MKTYTVMMPRELTAENGAKGFLTGEFFEELEIDCPDCNAESGIEDDKVCETCNDDGALTQRIPVSWTTIKAIYAKAVEHLAT